MKRLINAMSPSQVRRNAAAIDRLAESTAALRRDLRDIHESLNRLSAQAAEAQQRTEQLVDSVRRDIDERSKLTALPRAKLLSDALALEGSLAQRMRVTRRSVGQPIERSFSRWMGLTRCASAAADVCALWARLLAQEAECGDVLRGFPSTILDVSGAVVSKTATDTLRVSLRSGGEATTTRSSVGDSHAAFRDGVCAVPRFAYDFPARKVRNFGHWLLDCVPQVVAVRTIAPDAVFLLPEPLRGFHEATLSLVGLTHRQMVPWDGAPIACERLLVFESDGRTGGGRPLSALIELRRLVVETADASKAPPGRRIYVSRRDARAKRRWLSNEPAVEAVFQSRGFEVLSMADCPIEEQVRIFRAAEIVAGISGAGLADIVFSLAGTHVVVLLSDSLIRWYADESGQRSAWVSAENATGGQLAAFGDSPRFYAHLAAAFEQYCHCFVGGDEMPLDQLSGFLDDLLGNVDRT